MSAIFKILSIKYLLFIALSLICVCVVTPYKDADSFVLSFISLLMFSVFAIIYLPLIGTCSYIMFRLNHKASHIIRLTIFQLPELLLAILALFGHLWSFNLFLCGLIVFYFIVNTALYLKYAWDDLNITKMVLIRYVLCCIVSYACLSFLIGFVMT